MVFKWIIFFIIWTIIILFSKAILRKLEKLIDKWIDSFLDLLSLKKTLYKRKSKKIQEDLLNFIESEKNFQEKVKLKYKYGVLSDEPLDWKIIRINKSSDLESIEKSIIIQMPTKSQFYLERNIFNTNYKEALFLALGNVLATKYKKGDIMEYISKKVKELNISKEFIIIQEILSSENKKIALLEEAKRRYWSSMKLGGIGETTKREFCKFIEDLYKSNVGIMLITNDKLNPENYLIYIKSFLERYNTIHIYARGSLHIKLLDNLKVLIWEKFRRILNFSNEGGEYDWEDAKGNIIYKAKTLIIERKI